MIFMMKFNLMLIESLYLVIMMLGKEKRWNWTILINLAILNVLIFISI